jgi:hypothetical protein
LLPSTSGWWQQGSPKRWYRTTSLRVVKNPEDRDLNLHHRENFKSHNIKYVAVKKSQIPGLMT